MLNESFWNVFGLESNEMLASVKKAYAQQLKKCRPDEDPINFMRLNEAFKQAKDYFAALEKSKSFQTAMPQTNMLDTDNALTGDLLSYKQVSVGKNEIAFQFFDPCEFLIRFTALHERSTVEEARIWLSNHDELYRLEARESLMHEFCLQLQSNGKWVINCIEALALELGLVSEKGLRPDQPFTHFDQLVAAWFVQLCATPFLEEFQTAEFKETKLGQWAGELDERFLALAESFFMDLAFSRLLDLESVLVFFDYFNWSQDLKFAKIGSQFEFYRYLKNFPRRVPSSSAPRKFAVLILRHKHSLLTTFRHLAKKQGALIVEVNKLIRETKAMGIDPKSIFDATQLARIADITGFGEKKTLFNWFFFYQITVNVLMIVFSIAVVYFAIRLNQKLLS